MVALSAEELMAWVDRTAEGWAGLLREHPEVLGMDCDILETGTVAKLLQHIVAVELRYVQRLAEVPETSYDEVGFGSAEEIFATHKRAMGMLREVMARPEFDWEQRIAFTTRSAGTLRATRRTVLVHALMHSIRHYAQLATLVRRGGVKPGWAMDYLFMGAERD